MNPIEKLKQQANIKEEFTSYRVMKIKEVQDKTYTDMLNILSQYGMCNVVRPTGFGKTRIFMRYANENKHKRFLYVYDTNAVLQNIQNKYDTSNVEFVSYSLLSMSGRFPDNVDMFLNGEYDVVIFDESHLMGALNITKLLESVLPSLIRSGCYILGGTATPIRSDMVNVTNTFFDGHSTYEYTIVDAFNDGLFEQPFYSIMLYSQVRVREDIEKFKDNKYIADKLTQLEYAYANKVGASSVYRKAVERVYPVLPKYMKFIFFYPTIKSMKDNVDDLRIDFERAFPEYNIKMLLVSSDKEHEENYKDIDTLEPTDMSIDIIACVDMLNQGYHSDTLTGIGMNRATSSNIIYTQQLGRCLNIMSNHRSIVFDNVGNFNINPFDGIQKIQEGSMSCTDIDMDEKVFRILDVIVDDKELDFAQWYFRIKSIENLTQDYIDKARKLYNDFMAPIDFIERECKVPEWLLKEEGIIT